MPGGENFVESDSVTFTRVTRKHAGIYKYVIIIITFIIIGKTIGFVISLSNHNTRKNVGILYVSSL